VTPSLADVFADAGAAAVVGTSWAVHDDTAARTMREFIRHYAGGENDPIGALARARDAMAAENPDPRFWAGFTVTINELPKLETVAHEPRARHPRLALVGGP
jgi:CHAT domain-containing protein